MLSSGSVTQQGVYFYRVTGQRLLGEDGLALDHRKSLEGIGRMVDITRQSVRANRRLFLCDTSFFLPVIFDHKVSYGPPRHRKDVITKSSSFGFDLPVFALLRSCIRALGCMSWSMRWSVSGLQNRDPLFAFSENSEVT